MQSCSVEIVEEIGDGALSGLRNPLQSLGKLETSRGINADHLAILVRKMLAERRTRFRVPQQDELSGERHGRKFRFGVEHLPETAR